MGREKHHYLQEMSIPDGHGGAKTGGLKILQSDYFGQLSRMQQNHRTGPLTVRLF